MIAAAKIALTFAFAAQAVLACTPPKTVQIVAPDPCATLALVQDGWRETLKRVWFVARVNEMLTGVSQPLPTEDLAAMGRVKFVSHPSEYFYSPEYGDFVYGIFLPRSTPEIHFAEATPAVLKHEIAHWFYWRFRREYGDVAWRWVGHQAPESDPFWDALKAVEKLLYQ